MSSPAVAHNDAVTSDCSQRCCHQLLFTTMSSPATVHSDVFTTTMSSPTSVHNEVFTRECSQRYLYQQCSQRYIHQRYFLSGTLTSDRKAFLLKQFSARGSVFWEQFISLDENTEQESHDFTVKLRDDGLVLCI